MTGLVVKNELHFCPRTMEFRIDKFRGVQGRRGGFNIWVISIEGFLRVPPKDVSKSK